MKASRILILCSAVALPQLAMAELHGSPQALGMVHAILDFCAQADPHDAAVFRAEWRQLVGGAPDGQLGSLVSSSDYKKGYTLISSELDQRSGTAKAKAATACAADASPVKDDHKRPTNGQAARPRK